MQVFIAGIMQGARLDDQIQSQNYRERITEALQVAIPGVQIIDPWAENPDSVNYDAVLARDTFLTMTRRAGEADLLIAYLPRVSMGTAMEMWQAFESNTYIIAITPHVHHWAIRFTADEIMPDLETLLADIGNGRIPHILKNRAAVV